MPSFRWWFTSQVLSSSGLFTQGVAAAWLILQQGGGATDLALLTSASMLPVLCLGSWGGSLVDRFDRRRLLIATQAALLLLSGTLAALAFAGLADLRSILIVSAISGVVNAVDNPARQVYVIDLVGRDLLVSAISLFEVMLNASRVIGPAVGAVILTTAGPAPCFAVNALSFLAPIIVLFSYRSGQHVTRARPAAAEQSVPEKGRVREGLRYVRSVPEIRACVAIALASGLLFGPTVFYPLLAADAFHLNGGGYGALVATFGLGALPGAVLAARSKGRPNGRLILGLVALTACSMAITAFAPDVWVAFIGLALSGFASIWYIATANALVQLRADARLRGRVMGVWVMALPGMSPVTSLLAAVVVHLAGIRFAYFAAGIALLVAAVSGWRALWPVSGRAAGQVTDALQPAEAEVSPA